MFNIEYNEELKTLFLSGKFDGSREKLALDICGTITSSVSVDMSDLDYISSAGIGVLVKTLVRLKDNGGHKITLINLNNHIMEVFKISRLDTVFEILS